jgi:hypothetical protein
MAMLTVAARLFRNRAHAEISTSQQVHAGCGQLACGLAALAPPSPCSPPGPPPPARRPMSASGDAELRRAQHPLILRRAITMGPGIILPGIGFDPTRALV